MDHRPDSKNQIKGQLICCHATAGHKPLRRAVAALAGELFDTAPQVSEPKNLIMAAMQESPGNTYVPVAPTGPHKSSTFGARLKASVGQVWN